MTRVTYQLPEQGQKYRALVAEHGSPLFVLDAHRLRLGYRALTRSLPNVRMHYAVKSLPEAAVVRVLAEQGASFDLASAGEVALVQRLGVSGRRTIHTHPIKTDREIRTALRFGCTTFVVDNGFEIQKFVRFRHRVGLLLRVGFRNPNAQVDLSRKFGCTLDDVPSLLTQAAQLGIHVKGLSFHVGSQCATPDQHVAAIEACKGVMSGMVQGESAPMSVLDIGGGFPVDYISSCPDDAERAEQLLDRFCAPIRATLAMLSPTLEIWAEPGRCLSAPPVELVCSVVGKAVREGQPWYYLDAGVYGAFSGQIYDGTQFPLVFFGGAGRAEAVLAGPTCDSIDVVRESVLAPELGLGDIVVARQIGAYSSASATEFNSLPRTRLVVVNEKVDVDRPALRAFSGGDS